jgi:hypothetical protein
MVRATSLIRGGCDGAWLPKVLVGGWRIWTRLRAGYAARPTARVLGFPTGTADLSGAVWSDPPRPRRRAGRYGMGSPVVWRRPTDAAGAPQRLRDQGLPRWWAW